MNSLVLQQDPIFVEDNDKGPVDTLQDVRPSSETDVFKIAHQLLEEDHSTWRLDKQGESILLCPSLY